jgi:hypothetical protein
VSRCDLCAERLRDQDVVWIKDGLAIARCPRCTLVQRRGRPARADLDAIYGGGYFRASDDDLGGQGYADYLADADFHRVHARRRLALLAQLGAPGALLDVGAAAGFFVAEATAQGWDARGIDVSPEMTAWGRERLGVELETAAFGEAAAPPGSLAALTMWDYLEHSLSPRRDLEDASAMLRPHGLLALSTGDIGSLAARLSGSRWHLLTPRHHNFFFTRTTLRRYLAEAGLQPVFERHLGARYPLRYLAHKSRLVLPTALADALSGLVARSRVAELGIPVNLRDILTVIARKRERR